jgi:hypothetical protein
MNRLVAVAVFLSLPAVPAFARSGDVPKQDAVWKKYSNKELGYCLSYPARWVRGEAFDGAGMYFETGVKKFSKPLGEIDIEAMSIRPSDPDAEKTSNPVEYFQVHLEGLKKFERAQQLEVLDKRLINLWGTSALFTKDRYYDPQDRATWVDEIVLAKHGEILFRLELECRADQLNRFEPVFSRFVNTFKFDCNAGR